MKKGVLRNLTKFIGKQLCQSIIEFGERKNSNAAFLEFANIANNIPILVCFE